MRTRKTAGKNAGDWAGDSMESPLWSGPGSASSTRVLPQRNLPSLPAGQVRILGGQWKRTLLPVQDRPGLRPTPSRVRETLFNWLGQDLSSWHCIDAFAGSGALGFEAASRGAQTVLLVELDRLAVRQLQACKVRLQAHQIQIQQGDAVNALRRTPPGSQHLVLLDPPFSSQNRQQLDTVLYAAHQTLAENGLIYLESPTPCYTEPLAALDLVVHRQGQAGMVHFCLLRKG